MRPIRVLVVDDHHEMLSAMVSVLSDDPRFAVAGTATTGEEAVRLAETSTIDAVLLDVNMPGGGAATASALSTMSPAPVVVAISAHLGAASVEDMVRAGAVGYLAKGRVGDTLPDLLARCVEGEVVLASPAAAAALRSLVNRGPEGRRFGTPTDSP
jgi:DNA-binding NarL/FixJ family response regulator